MRARASSVGCGNSILRSRRPERSSAGSRMSILFVAATTCEMHENTLPETPLTHKRESTQKPSWHKTLIASSTSARHFTRCGRTATVRDLDAILAAETIKLIQQFQHGPLHLPVTRKLRIEALGSDCIQLVNEDDRPAVIRALHTTSFSKCAGK